MGQQSETGRLPRAVVISILCLGASLAQSQIGGGSNGSSFVECAPGSVYSSAHDACVWVMLDTDAQDCPPEGVCRPSMPSTCGLWSDNATALGMQQCDRLYSPSLEYVLALHPDATLVLYKLDPVTGQLGEEVWATGERYGYSARLTLYTDPVLVIDAIKEDGEMDVFFPDGTEYYDAMDPDKAPYTLVVGDDGIVRILNRLGQVAWASKDVLTPPVLAPPPSYGPYGPYGPYGHGSSPPPYGYPPAYAPPSSAPSYSPPPPPPPPPAGNPPYASCATGAAFNPRLGRCVWVEVRYDPSGFCNYNRYCTDAAMSSTCDLYANDDGTSTPDSPYLCDRIFSPSMRYALVLERDSDLAVYDYGTEAGDSWTLVSAIVTGALFGRAQEHQLTLDAEGNWYINYSALGRDVSSSIYGISMGEYRGSDKAPFRLTLGDDGIVRLLNREDQVAWLSSLPAPPQPPPSPPSPPPSPPATPAPPVVCAPGSAFNPYLDRCVWVQLSLGRGEMCPRTRSCSDPTMPPSCGLYAPAAATGTPDSPYLCDRVFSPNMRYALVVLSDRLTVYEYGTGTGSSWANLYDLGQKFTDLTSGSDDAFLVLQSSGEWLVRGDVWASGSSDVGTAYPLNAEEARAPFRLTVGDDGTVQILNRDGEQAWVGPNALELF